LSRLYATLSSFCGTGGYESSFICTLCVDALLLAGADACLAKPLALDSLERELARLLGPSAGA